MISKDSLRKLIIACVVIFGVSLLAYSLRSNNKSGATPSPRQGKVAQSKDDGKKEEERSKIDIKSATSQFVLVNKTYAIEPIDFKPGDLLVPEVNTSSSDSKDEQSVRRVVSSNLEKMMGAAKSAKLDLVMNSGFRSYKSQSFYFNNYVKQSGLEAAKKFSAEPGHSEHQTGLAFDINYVDKKCYLDVCFGQTDAGKWLAEHAHEYGFILRYPDGKTDITGYQYEPWHFRYVGKDVAKEIFSEKLTYEEYLAKLKLITL